MTDTKYLELLAQKFPNKKAATGEIINLRAILALPKGTEYFFSDLHGEYEAFRHMIKSASGVIRSKVEELFGNELTVAERDSLASLVYDAKNEIRRKKETEEDFDQWCFKAIYQLIEITKSVSTKYSRSRVRRRLPEYWAYSIDELLHADDEANKTHYYNEIIATIVESDLKETFIEELADSISLLAIDRLHIIGDIWDRGAHPDYIMDYLMGFDNIDFQWGNHDMVWMGAATGNWPCIANVLRMNINYYNFDMLEVGYGINLRALSSFAQQVYADDPCTHFRPKIFDESKFDPVDEGLAAKMHKAIAVIQFKIEGQRILEHPEWGLDHRLLLDKIDYEKGTVTIRGKEWELRDTFLPTVDPADPYKLTNGEKKLMSALTASFTRSRTLQEHIRFLFSHGALYKVVNNNLMYHGCIPMTEEGEFQECTMLGKTFKGKAYMDYLDETVRTAYFDPDKLEGVTHRGDIMWLLWLHVNSPLFGKDQMTTFERLFIADKRSHKENTVPYYRLIKEGRHVDTILREFGLDPNVAHILNGHVPVKFKDGESPIKGGGKLIVIDGGISKAYQKSTGIAGYTFIYNSRFMALAQHLPYSPLQPDGTQEFHAPTIRTVEVLPQRYTVKDTDQGREIEQQIEDLQDLVKAFDSGLIEEVN